MRIKTPKTTISSHYPAPPPHRQTHHKTGLRCTPWGVALIEQTFYNVCMLTSIESKAGSWILLVGPRSLNTTMLNAVARLGEGGASAAHAAETANSGLMPPWPAVRILDGGNRFNAYTVARAARGQPEVLKRITVARAFTCYQVRSLLESTPAIPVPFVVLDLLSTFYDESVQVGERKRLLRACTMHMERLAGAAGGSSTTHVVETAMFGESSRRTGQWHLDAASTRGSWKLPRLVVSVHPPKVPSQAAIELLEMLQASAADTYFIRPPAPAPEPMRLF